MFVRNSEPVEYFVKLSLSPELMYLLHYIFYVTREWIFILVTGTGIVSNNRDLTSKVPLRLKDTYRNEALAELEIYSS